MGKFNLSEYDQVGDRIKKFLEKYEDGRITTRVLFQNGERTMVKAYIYLNKEDQANKCPKATGIAEEEREDRKQTSQGTTYEPVNFSSWTENCETSAIGRGLANMDMSGNKRPSRQEMEKVDRYQNRGTIVSRATTGPQNSDSKTSQKKATMAQVKLLKDLGCEATEGEYLEMAFEEADKQIKLLINGK